MSPAPSSRTIQLLQPRSHHYVVTMTVLCTPSVSSRCLPANLLSVTFFYAQAPTVARPLPSPTCPTPPSVVVHPPTATAVAAWCVGGRPCRSRGICGHCLTAWNNWVPATWRGGWRLRSAVMQWPGRRWLIVDAAFHCRTQVSHRASTQQSLKQGNNHHTHKFVITWSSLQQKTSYTQTVSASR